MEPATSTDVEEIFQLIKEAYKIEIGDSGLAFKCADRYTTRTAVLKDIPDMWVMRSSDQNKKGRQIVACAKGSLNDANQIIDIGPLAVRPDYQGQGLGSKVLDFLEQLAPIQVVGLVSCRTDIEPMYLKRGYKLERRDPITDHVSKEQLTRSEDVVFCVMVRNNSKLSLPKTIGMSESLE